MLEYGADDCFVANNEAPTPSSGAGAVTVLAGGRYDGLAEMLGGAHIPAIGRRFCFP
jgi:histidyl-tRNA synthetase